jgi:hypothetical protein
MGGDFEVGEQAVNPLERLILEQELVYSAVNGTIMIGQRKKSFNSLYLVADAFCFNMVIIACGVIQRSPT